MNIVNRAFRICLLPVVVITAWAQQNLGVIVGRITDPSSAVVAGALVSITNQATGVKRNATTSGSGDYAFGGLPFGTYDIVAEAKGFRKLARKDIRVYVGETLTLELSLEIGSVDQTVEVTGAAPLIESSTSDLGTVVDSKQVNDLPLAVSGNMRSPESFILLAPGVVGSASTPNINGSQQRSKEVLFDGVMSTGAESGGVMFTVPPVEAVGEFKLEAANFSAEYGHSGGGVEVFSTKSGANQLHGSAFEYLRNDKFDARGFISPTTPVNRQNEFGASFGGPVRLPHYNGKNRTFFYFVYDGFRYRSAATNSLLTLPTAAQRNGDFSGLTKGGGPLQIYDPASTTTNSAGAFTRNIFPNAQIPLSRMSKVAVAMLQVLPAATNAAINNYTSFGAAVFNRDTYTFKIDHSFSDRSRMSLFGYADVEDSIDAASIQGAWSPALDTKRPDRWLRFNHDFSFSGTLLNNFRAGYTHAPQIWDRVRAGQGDLQKVGLLGVNPPDNVLPQLNFADTYSAWGSQIKNQGEQVNNTLQFADTVSWIHGNHSFKFGGDARWQQTNGADHANQQGSFTFSSNETALPTALSTTGNSFASFLVGAVDSANYNELFVVPGTRYHYFAYFLQDDWKVNKKLTVNLGLRWDYFSPREEHNSNISGFDPALPNPGAGGLLGAIGFLGNGTGRNGRSSFANADFKDYGPRFGFAYELTQKIVIRGGCGLSYGIGNAAAGLRDSQNFIYGFNAAPSYASTNSGVTPAFALDSGFPTNWPLPPFINPTVQNGTSVNMIGRDDGRAPYFLNDQISVQYSLPGQATFEAAYVGVKGTRLGTNLINLNQVNPKYLALGSLLTQSVTSAAAVAAGIPIPYPGFTGSVAQALRPYPQYQTISNKSNPNGNSTYSALQLKYTKRLSHGLTVLVAYTWSKTIADGDISAGGGDSGQDYYNRRLEKGIADYDVPQLLSIAYTYELPFGKGKQFLNNGVASQIVGGWQLTGIQQYQSGMPVQLTVNDTLPIFNQVLRPNLNAGVPLTLDPANPLANPWFNKAAFSIPGNNQFGDVARSLTQLRAPNSYSESFGLMKRIRIKERVTVTLRAEFFNAFNRTVFGAPASNLSAANFGFVSSQANAPRQGLMSLRIDF
jgi:hypothetical protein